MLRRSVLSALGAAALAPRLAFAGKTELLADHPGTWRAWEENLQGERLLAPNADERKKFLENVAAYAGKMREHPAWAKPKGFDVRPERSISGDTLHEIPPHPIPGG